MNYALIQEDDIKVEFLLDRRNENSLPIGTLSRTDLVIQLDEGELEAIRPLIDDEIYALRGKVVKDRHGLCPREVELVFHPEPIGFVRHHIEDL